MLPDELLFSRIVRYLVVSGQPASKLLLDVYGNHKASIHPYLTSGLTNLAELANEDADTLLFQQTLAPLFVHCLPAHAANIYSALLSSDVCKAIRTSQLSCVREREPLSLKYCPLCVESDIREHGVSFWHRSHQIPGIESCSKHPVWLVHVALPERIRTNVGQPSPSTCVIESSLLSFDLAHHANNFLFNGNNSSDYIVDFDFYKEKLLELGYATRNYKIRRRLLCSAFYQFTLQLRYPSDNLLPKSEVDYKYLSYLLRKNASQQPFKHILFSYWLNKAEPIEYGSTKISQVVCSNNEKSRCLELLKKGDSIASISKELGKSRCFVKSLAFSASIHSRLKPTILTPQVCQSVIVLAKKGFHRKEIARRFSISTGSVEMLISATNGLVEWRKQCKHESKRRSYKLQILRYRQNNPKAIRRDIKFDCNAAFFWLYLHQREWLEANLPDATPPHSNPRRKH